MRFEPVVLTTDQLCLREHVRDFLSAERAHHQWPPGAAGEVFDADFSKRLAGQGWVGMALPSVYGGHDRTATDRFIVVEELLSAGAPLGTHWIADRQSGPTILAFGTEEQRETFLPGIARAEVCFCIGMSEPDAGSDLASVRTSAQRTVGGWTTSGTKIWTSGADHADYMITLVRTTPHAADRHSGLSQFIIDMRSVGVTVNPILTMDGGRLFNEVVLDDVFVPDERVLGEIGSGWHQVTSELSFERSGPDRYLSTYPLLHECVDNHRELFSDDHAAEALGELVARYWSVRQMSLSVADALDRKLSVAAEAALVKDIGTQLEQRVVRVLLDLIDQEPDPGGVDQLAQLLSHHVLMAASHTIRGGTTEVLRTIIARSLARKSRP
jgi:alkylation response protein AidB-like acyl-CoA dehydrogenase